ncbi:MAG TPA: hypothetical protein VF053_10610 [Streptosporangiales bacterium]
MVRQADRRLFLLGGVAVIWVVVQFVLTFHVALGWDETTYLSQYAGDVPPGVFSAPRARGLPLIVAPIVAFTTSVPAIRVYLTVLSGVGLFVAFLPWLRVRAGYVVPLAAALFASVWVALFYGNEAMPDMFVAYAAVAAVGLFVLAVRPGPQTGAVAGLLVAVTVCALVRPSDALWVAAPLVVAGLVVRAWRRPAAVLAVVGGVVAGWAEWFAEAYAYYGGPLARLRAAGAENQTGLHFSLWQHVTALSQAQILCRPACHPASPVVAVWFFAIPVVAVAGCVLARRSRQFAPLVLAAATAAVFTASYVFGVGYAAPRFLLPAYALASLPVAEAVAQLLGGVRTRARPVLAGVVLIGAIAHVGVQVHWMDAVLHKQIPPRDATARVGAKLARLGVVPPCLVYGHDAAQAGFYAHCAEWSTKHAYGGARPPTRLRVALAQHRHVVVVVRQRALPAPYLVHWRRVALTGVGKADWYAYLPAATTRR